MERLSADDQVMLWPDALWPQEIGAVAILDGSSLLGPDGQVGSGRYEPCRIPAASGSPVPAAVARTRAWTRRTTVDRRAVRSTSTSTCSRAAAAPGDEAALLRAVERLRRQRLDRSRPLWQMCLLPGLPDGRVGLFVKLHHAIADGIAGIATIATFLDAVADPRPHGYHRGRRGRARPRGICWRTTRAALRSSSAMRWPRSGTR